MADGLDQLEHHLDGLLERLAPAERVRLAHQLGRELRRSQSNRIRRNLDPEGAPFAPRKERPALRSKKGRIKRRRAAGPMFKQIGKSDAMAWEASADGVSVGYAETALARVVRVHQLGLRDKVINRPGAPEAQYPVRRLLGLTTDDRRRILNLVLDRLSLK